jgi:glucarate dehydratase
VELDMPRVEAAHRLYQRIGVDARNDAVAMQFLIPGWQFDHKRPCLIR